MRSVSAGRLADSKVAGVVAMQSSTGSPPSGWLARKPSENSSPGEKNPMYSRG